MDTSINYPAAGLRYLYQAEFRSCHNENKTALVQHLLVCKALPYSPARYTLQHCKLVVTHFQMRRQRLSEGMRYLQFLFAGPEKRVASHVCQKSSELGQTLSQPTLVNTAP